MSSSCWFTDLLHARNNDAYNNLIIIEGETGTGKSCMGLSLLQHLDDYASVGNIIYSKSEFYNALKTFKRGTILWDECGVYISHRQWLSQEQINIMQILQSFRYRKLNVIFTLPSAGYMDKVAREMCHFLINMSGRGIGQIYRIMKTTYQSWTYTPFMGLLYSQMPTKMLWDEFTKKHDEHIDEFIRLSEEKSLAGEKKETENLERTMKGRRPLEEDVQKALLILPEIVDVTKDSDQGMIGVNNMQKVFKDRLGIQLAHNRSYHIRDELLNKLHENNDRLLVELRVKKKGMTAPTSVGTGINSS